MYDFLGALDSPYRSACFSALLLLLAMRKEVCTVMILYLLPSNLRAYDSFVAWKQEYYLQRATL